MSDAAGGHRTARRAVLVAGGTLIAVAALYTAAGAWLRPWVERELERGLGYRVTIGGLGWNGGLAARDVTVYGRAPFEREALARIETATLRLGGTAQGPFWAPSEVTLEGAEVVLLATRGADNVRGSGPHKGEGRGSEPSVGAAGRTRTPAIVIARGSLRALYRGPDGPRVEVRARALAGRLRSRQLLDLRIEDIAVDVERGLSLSVRRADVTGSPGGMRVTAPAATLSVPGGGPLVEGLAALATIAPDGVEARLGSPQGGFHLAAKLLPDTAALEVSARRLALTALRPLLAPHGLVVEHARADLDVTIEWPLASAMGRFTAAASLDGVGVNAPSLDLVPWTDLAGRWRAQGRFSAAEGRIELDDSQGEALGLPLSMRGWLELGAWGRGETRGRLAVSTPPGREPACARLLAAQPRPVRAALEGLALEGRLGLEMTLAFDASDWDKLALDLAVDPLCRVAREPEAVTALIEALRTKSWPERWRELPLHGHHAEFTPLKKLPRHLVSAFVTAEDVSFFRHRGFDLANIRRALAHDLEVGTFAKGASTLTQQLAKNLFLGPQRTVARKLEEAALAWRLEQALPKDQILELYLNIIELGPGIRGVGQAARSYFGKPAAGLSPLEAAHLAALTPNPVGFARRFRDGRVDESWLHRLYDLLGMMKRTGHLSASQLQAARVAKLTLRKI